MDVRSELIALLSPVSLGAEIAEGARWIEASTELGMRLVIATSRGPTEVEVEIEVDPIEEGRRFAARSSRFGFGYRVGDARAPIDPALGRALCERIASLARANEDAMIARLRTASERARAEDDPAVRARVREVRVERLLERGGMPGERYWTLSPYVGCLIGCRFCYAPSRLDPVRRLEGRADAPWGSWVDVRVNAAEVLARELAELSPRPIKLCPIVSDPYHAIERRYRVTRACLDVLGSELGRAAGRGILVLTRSTAVVEDAERIAAIPGAHAGMSLPTIDDDVRARFEPRGASVAERLAALRALRAAGVRTFAIVQPILPGSIDALADALAETVGSARIDVLHGAYGAEADFAAEPRFAAAREPAWQAARADELAAALIARGVEVWPGELPRALLAAR